MKYIAYIFVLLALIGLAQAATINDTLVNMSSVHTILNITYPIDADTIQWNTTYFMVTNCNSSHPNQTGTYQMTYNYTSAQNLTGYQLPYVSTYNSNQIIITYGGTNPLNISFYSCQSFAPETVTYHSGLGNFTTWTGSAWSSSVLCANLSILTLETGSNQINFTYASSSHGAEVDGICEQMYLAYGLVGLIVVVLIGTGALLILTGGGAAMPIIMAAITSIVVIVVGMIVLLEMCV